MIAARFLAELLDSGEIPTRSFGTGLDGRLAHALQRMTAATQAGVTGLDWAVLMRQCLRCLPSDQEVAASALDERTLALLRRVDVRQELDGTMVADAYRPDWVSDLGQQALDLPRANPGSPERDVPGEPWLRRMLGKAHWKSEPQREAAWRAIKAPPNSTLLVGLPTGAGKSLVYQCAAAFELGLTVLVVPTVALGIDQRAAVLELPCAAAWEPLLYTPDEDPEAVLDAVESGRCRLLITSPEAIVAGRLRNLLRQQAEQGLLHRLVVDEAHLIESWGAEFRVAFQLLGAVLRDWRTVAPMGIRTLLLSATFSPSTPDMLRALFTSEGVPWDELIVQRLRPEIHYFAAHNWAEREQQVTWIKEALTRLPRPAILYVSKVAHAIDWGRWLTEDGFRRLEVFHGDTPGKRRKAIMRAWRKGELDLIVATSAFGMGVDKPDVRAVVHACFPEGVDRFYQEVGRGGRDGAPCVSLLVPTLNDERVARNLGPTLLGDPEKIAGRWRALWRSRLPVSDDAGNVTGQFRVRVEVQPDYRVGEQSFGENTQWNKRLLLMMDRAGLVRVESLAYERPHEGADRVEFAVLRLLRSSLELETRLPDLLAQSRQSEVATIHRAVDGLRTYFLRQAPICRALRSHYGPVTVRACGSCGSCRAHGERAVPMMPLGIEQPSTLTTTTTPSVQLVQTPALNDGSSKAVLIQALRQVMQGCRIDHLVISRAHRLELESLVERAMEGVTTPYRIDVLDPRQAQSILPGETVLILHVDVIDVRAAAFNWYGRLVTHWLLGGTLEQVPGRWPFMHEHQARAYSGPDGLTQWLYDMGRPGVLPSTHPVH